MPQGNKVYSDVIEGSDFQNFNKIFIESETAATPTLQLARTLFELREYNKCCYILKPFAKPAYQSSLFLYYYAKYLISEAKAEEEGLNKLDGIKPTDKELSDIEQDLKEYYNADKLNAINIYLYGMICKKKGSNIDAINCFIKAINLFPCLWSCWIELVQLLSSNDRNIFDRIRKHWISQFYLISFLLETKNEGECIKNITDIQTVFPNSVHLYDTIARACYTIQEFDSALDWFEKAILIDPYRYESMDLYSNILYIKENYGALAHLAFNMHASDKYRPETCCVIGNYFSLRGDHSKAVIYFKRAIKLDRNFLSAWTLMGHEYLEMKNAQAAIESYRSAVDIDPSDYRAWYGLGQTYEIHQMFNYASYYYANAALSKPQDSRMWSALAGCYDKTEKKCEATKCYEKSEQFRDKEGILFKQA
jgi:anaphase-promoting complex subunit 8